MSYPEKRKVMEILVGAAVLIAYCLYALEKYRSGAFAPDDYQVWAVAMLKFIALGIVVSIVAQILFHVGLSVGIAVKSKIKDGDCQGEEIERSISAEMVEDERDKLISLKARLVIFIFMAIGFVWSLVMLAFGYSPLVMMHILFGAFSIGSLMEGFVQLYLYRRGVRHV